MKIYGNIFICTGYQLKVDKTSCLNIIGACIMIDVVIL